MRRCTGKLLKDALVNYELGETGPNLVMKLKYYVRFPDRRTHVNHVIQEVGWLFTIIPILLSVCSNHPTSQRHHHSSTQCTACRPPGNFVNGQTSTMWDIVCSSPYKYSRLSVSTRSGGLLHSDPGMSWSYSAGHRGVVWDRSLGRKQLSRQWGNDLLPQNDPRPPSIAYPPRSRSQAHLSCLIKPFSFMYSVFTLNGGGDDDTLMFWTVISLMRLCLTDSRSTRAAERKQQKH